MNRIRYAPDAADLSFDAVLQKRLSRREVMRGGVSTALASFLPLGLLGCDNSNDPLALPGVSLGFAPVSKSLADAVAIPTGYSAQTIYRLGDPIAAGIAAYANDGTDADFDKRAGDHHDGIHY